MAGDGEEYDARGLGTIVLTIVESGGGLSRGLGWMIASEGCKWRCMR